MRLCYKCKAAEAIKPEWYCDKCLKEWRAKWVEKNRSRDIEDRRLRQALDNEQKKRVLTDY